MAGSRRAVDTREAEGLIWRRQGRAAFAGRAPDPVQVLAAGSVGATDFIDVIGTRLCIEPGLAAQSDPFDARRLK